MACCTCDLPSNLFEGIKPDNEDWLLTYFIFYDILEHGNWELKFGWTVRQTSNHVYQQSKFSNNTNFTFWNSTHPQDQCISLWISMKTFDDIFTAFHWLVQAAGDTFVHFTALLSDGPVPQNSSCDNLTNWQTGIFLVTISNNFYPPRGYWDGCHSPYQLVTHPQLLGL